VTVAPGATDSTDTTDTSGVTRAALVAELAEVVGAPHEARFIVDEVLGLELVLGHPDPPAGALDPAAVGAARALAARRAAGEPLQYVFGHWSFRALDLTVDERVLIPRPETEQVVEVALAEARRLAARRAAIGVDGVHEIDRADGGDEIDRVDGGDGLVVVDAGTGSGAIALALATELGAGALAAVGATDASTDALAVAAANLEAVRAGQAGRADHGGVLPPVTFYEGNWLEPLPDAWRGRVDVVVSNPPYVSEDEWPALSPEVRQEPRPALVAARGSDGTPGLAGVEAVLAQARGWLRRPGAVIVELAPHQADAATALAGNLGYGEVRVESDLAGRRRALVARIAG
jgi:release factor glutamine methyltransferase